MTEWMCSSSLPIPTYSGTIHSFKPVPPPLPWVLSSPRGGVDYYFSGYLYAASVYTSRVYIIWVKELPSCMCLVLTYDLRKQAVISLAPAPERLETPAWAPRVKEWSKLCLGGGGRWKTAQWKELLPRGFLKVEDSSSLYFWLWNCIFLI